MAKTLNKEIKEVASNTQTPISLDEIIHEYSKIATELELGELTEELEERLIINEENINRKLLGYRYIILNNEAKINNIYKPEIEKLSSRIKKFERTNEYLKDKVCLAAEVFGTNNKYQSDTINVSSVETVSLNTNDELVEESLNHIKECILNNDTSSITVETELVKIDLSFKDLTPEEAALIINLIEESNDMELINIHNNRELNVSLKRREATALVKEVEEFNNSLDEAFKAISDNTSEEDKASIPKQNYRTIEFKGLSLKSSRYPRFS